MNYSNITVVIPTLNEGKNIGKLIGLLEKYYNGIYVIVSDDSSKDNTQEIVKKIHSRNSRIMLLDRSKKKIHGLTISAVEGIKKAKTKYSVVIDGDLQHPPEKIKEVVQELKKSDVVVCTRTGGFFPKVTLLHVYRYFMSKIATILARIRLMFNLINCSDPMSGFFGVKTSIIKNMDERYFEMEGYKILFDMMKHLPKGTKLGKVYYVFGQRSGGTTKISSRHMKIFLKSLFR